MNFLKNDTDSIQKWKDMKFLKIILFLIKLKYIFVNIIEFIYNFTLLIIVFYFNRGWNCDNNKVYI